MYRSSSGSGSGNRIATRPFRLARWGTSNSSPHQKRHNRTRSHELPSATARPPILNSILPNSSSSSSKLKIARPGNTASLKVKWKHWPCRSAGRPTVSCYEKNGRGGGTGGACVSSGPLSSPARISRNADGGQNTNSDLLYGNSNFVDSICKSDFLSDCLRFAISLQMQHGCFPSNVHTIAFDNELVCRFSASIPVHAID